MLSIQRAAPSSDKCTLNIIPCRIHRDGPTKITKRFWSPSTETDGSSTAYFRGRKLRGKVIRLPSDYQGLVLKSTTRCLPLASKSFVPQTTEDDDMDDCEEEKQEPVKIIEEASTFDELLVWGHDQLPAADDPFIKGVEEWMSLAQAIHNEEHASDPTHVESISTQTTSDLSRQPHG